MDINSTHITNWDDTREIFEFESSKNDAQLKSEKSIRLPKRNVNKQENSQRKYSDKRKSPK